MLRYLTTADVVMLHEQVIHFSGGSHGVRDHAALEAACARPQSGYYSDAVEAAAALMESLIGNHPFIDGNKRIGFLATDVFLRLNGLRVRVDPLQAADVILEKIASGSFRFAFIHEWLRSIVHPVEPIH